MRQEVAGLEINLTPINGSKTAMIAEMSGAIDGNTVPAFVKKLEDLLAQGVESLILDMSNIRYVNSTGLGSLVKYADEFKKKNGGMALIKVPPKVKIVIEMLGLNAFFEICSDADAALQALGGSAVPAQTAPDNSNDFDLGPARDLNNGLGPARDLDPGFGGGSSDPFGGGPDPFGGGSSDPFGGTATKEPEPAGRISSGSDRMGAASSGGSGFPAVTECQSCKVKLKFNKAGAYKCPRCHVRIRVSDSGGTSFSKPESRGVEVSLPARQECGLGLLHLATSVCEKAMNGTALDAVRRSIHEVTQVLQQSIYANNPEGMYHVAMDLQSNKIDIRFSDSGAPIDVSRLKLYFPNSTRYMDSFDCQPHPSGGNIIRMTKGY